MIKFIWNYLISFIFPRNCPGCGDLVNWGKSWCDTCFDKELNIHYIQSKWDDCVVEEVLVLGRYENGLRKALHEIKFNGMSSLAAAMYPFFEAITDEINLAEIDYIIPIPINKDKLRERGYNQVDLIFKDWVKVHSGVWLDCLCKVNHTRAMYGLEKDERWLNIKDAYKLKEGFENIIRDKKVLIIDDIYTTGSTIEAVGRELKLHGAKKIEALTIAGGA